MRGGTNPMVKYDAEEKWKMKDRIKELEKKQDPFWESLAEVRADEIVQLRKEKEELEAQLKDAKELADGHLEALLKLKKQQFSKAGIDVSKLAEFIHKTYESLSKKAGWKTQKECQVDFDKLPKSNKKVMLQLSALLVQYINDNQERI